MNEQIKELTQPIEEIRDREIDRLKVTRAKREVLAAMPHLSELVREVSQNLEKGRPHRYILDTAGRDTALQAAAAVSSLLGEPVADEDEQDFFVEWDEEDEPDISWLLIHQDYFTQTQGTEQAVRQAAKELSGGDRKKEAVNQTDYLFIDCGAAVDEQLPDSLQMQNKSSIILWLREIQGNHLTVLERLMFEQDYRVIKVDTPPQEYYCDLLGRYLEKRGQLFNKEKRRSDEAGQRMDQTEIHTLAQELIQYRGGFFREMDLFRYADRALTAMADRKGSALCREDFYLPRLRARETGGERLERMIGLSEVRQQIRKICAERILRARMASGGRQKEMHHNLGFAGSPGTGKSEIARIYSEILAEEHIVNGIFIQVSRSDMIAQYVGQTAPKIRYLFDAADGGVLFIDEAGWLNDADEFVSEAVTELVRYMEERPQTTVIFATYPEKLKQFLTRDPGLSSRISRIITFPDYSIDELMQILNMMGPEYGCRMSRNCTPIIRDYLERRKQEQKENFGNAREVRKLLETAFAHYSVRALQKEQADGTAPDLVLRKPDFEKAIQELSADEEKKQKIGFQLPQTAACRQRRVR